MHEMREELTEADFAAVHDEAVADLRKLLDLIDGVV
jgi:hypothetical protein